MYGVYLPKQTARRPVAATTINDGADQVERTARLRVGSGLSQQTIDGAPYIRTVRRDQRTVRVTASLGPGVHAWQGLRDVAGGAYADLDAKVSDLAGADPLYEANGKTIPVGTVVEAERGEYSGKWYTQLDNCPS